MIKRVWIIEGWHGTTNFFSKEIPYAALSERQVKDVLKCVVAKHGLLRTRLSVHLPEIIFAFCTAP